MGLSTADLSLLLHAARCCGMEPSRLRASNPWRFRGAVAEALQREVRCIDPDAAERLQAEAAGVALSLEVAAAQAGLKPSQRASGSAAVALRKHPSVTPIGAEGHGGTSG
jgi:hypothetical protein